MSWPAAFDGPRVIREPAIGMDLFPTILDAAGIDASEYELDGLSVLPMVTSGEPSPHEELFWELMGQTAIRRGDWKLVLHGQLVENEQPTDDVHLANLRDDFSESHNLASDHPDLVDDLSRAALRWRHQVEVRWQEHCESVGTNPI